MGEGAVILHAIVTDLDTAIRAVSAGATVLQLRVKGATTAELIERGNGFGELDATFVVNDDVEAAIALGADGVHLGQSDRGADRARAVGLLLGRSASSFEEAIVASGDYLGVGPIWSTPSKRDTGPALGLAALQQIAASVELPVIAIGGVDAANAALCIRAGAEGVAAVRAATDPRLREAVDEALAAR